MSSLMETSEKKSSPRRTKAEIQSALDALDKDLPSNPGQPSAEKSEELKKVFDEALKDKEFKAGQVVQGAVLKVTGDHVIVDINYKSEGVIPLSEFCHFDKTEAPKPGQKVDVYIEQIEDKNGAVILSKDKANIKKVWRDIIQAKDNDESIQGKVISAVKGGLSVDIGIKAFLPGSQMDVRPVRNLDSYIGQTLDFKIIKINHKRGNVVLSRRPILERDRERMAPSEGLKEGSVVKGIVKNITDYGAFIDLGDRDGLLHITDMSWSRIEHPSRLLSLGQQLDLKILKLDAAKNRVSLGLKQLNEKKWEEAVSKYEIGSVVKGKVSSLVDYGAFILLDDGLEGLAHINELSWTRKARRPSQILKAGQELEVKIIDIKKDSRKLSLSLKQTQENPWNSLKEKLSIGDVGEFEVVSVSDFGFFVKVSDMIDGLVRAGDISWTENINPFDRYKVGDKVKAKILDIDPEGEKCALGVKQLEKNDWALVEEKYPVGSRHEVEISRIVDFGAFVKLEQNIEGLIHISELSANRSARPQDVARLGDKVWAEILSIDKSAKKIGLSVRLAQSSKDSARPSAGTAKKEDSAKSSPGLMESIFAKALKRSIKAPAEGEKGPEQKASEPEKSPAPPVQPETSDKPSSKSQSDSHVKDESRAKGD